MLNIAFTERGDTFPKSVTSFCNNVVLSNVAKRMRNLPATQKAFTHTFGSLYPL